MLFKSLRCKGHANKRLAKINFKVACLGNLNNFTVDNILLILVISLQNLN